jgi:SAM-dependent methyltransferase
LGQEKPHWSVLSTERFLPKNIEANTLEFYKSGADDVDLIMNILRANGIDVGSLRSAVEYGCGLGRVTPHLAAKFQSVTAIDISSSHIAMARQHCAEHPGITFELARIPEFGMYEPFDLWFSYIVLQHNPPPIIARILERAFAMLAPGGVAIFQVPTWCDAYRFRVADYLRSRPAKATIEVHCLPQSVIFELAHRAGCVPLEVRADNAMRPPGWASHVFAFQKQAEHAGGPNVSVLKS